MSAIRSTIYAATINSTTFCGITGYNMSNELQLGAEGHDGLVEPRYGTNIPPILEGKPMINIRSKDVYSILNACGISGLAISGVTLYWYATANKGTRASGSSHGKLTNSNAYAVVGSLNAQHNQKVIAELGIHPLSSDGLTHPLTGSTGQALSGSLASFSEYTLGPFYYKPSGGSTINIPAQSWAYEPGVTVTSENDDGLPYPDQAYMDFRAPVFRVQSHDMQKLLTTGMLGGGGGTATFFLRKLSPTGGTRVADATAEHIKFTVAACQYYCGDQSGETAPGKASGGITITPISDGTNPIVAINLASAIAAPA